MSHLGDLIVEHGPYELGRQRGWDIGKLAHTPHLNALRDELIELRAIRDAAQRGELCSACGSLSHGRDDCPKRGRGGPL